MAHLPPRHPDGVTHRSRAAITYICHAPGIPGKFLPEKAIVLGIPKGPLFGRLSSGSPVQSPSTGATVLPEHCTGPATPGKIFIIVRCPDMEYAINLTTHPLFDDYKAGRPSSPAFIVHITAAAVVQSSTYQAWMQSFGSETRHVVINAQMCAHNYIFNSATEHQIKLSELHRDVFPRPLCTPHPQVGLPEAITPFSCAAQNLMKLVLAPSASAGIDLSEALLMQAATTEASLDPQAISQYFGTIPGLFSEMDKFRAWKEGHVYDQTARSPSVTFLGTGSALPSKYRNVTGIYVTVPDDQGEDDHGVLFDCGEGSYGQLVRRFGADSMSSLIERLRFIFVSHLHADHHLGLVRILLARSRIPSSQPIHILGPKLLEKWLVDYEGISTESFAHTYTFEECGSYVSASLPVPSLGPNITAHTAPVIHCHDSYAVALAHTGPALASDPWKLVYSGDTQPCEELVVLGKGATVLIHEATMEQGMQVDAHEKNHSTIDQAAAVAMRMGARHTILTHFSQRYPKVPRLASSSSSTSSGSLAAVPGLSIAFDLMSVRFSRDLEALPRLLPALTLLFDHEESTKEEEKEDNKEKIKEEKQKQKDIKLAKFASKRANPSSSSSSNNEGNKKKNNNNNNNQG
eukprot:TRINITY_DN6835_c2_g2_i1.p1 TRINITY_DN6835_c2_g2~~TRINITY_DN6835_c2_g2_i1.p1  ORF type:complete len:664 (+),score=198.65 TRINITY_DN6835_c2_g2_i1:98-1993(+)